MSADPNVDTNAKKYEYLSYKELKTIIDAGATGLVGTTIIKVLEERNFPIDEIKLLASENSEGKEILFRGKTYKITTLSPDEFDGFDISFFALDSSLSKIYVPEAAKRKVKVVDNSSCFRMEENVPLVVPEINSNVIKEDDYIIANPNYSTIQCIAPL